MDNENLEIELLKALQLSLKSLEKRVERMEFCMEGLVEDVVEMQNEGIEPLSGSEQWKITGSN